MNAPSEQQADQLLATSEKAAFETSFEEAFATSRAKGRKSGTKKGRIQGRKAGRSAGASSGGAAADAELAAIAAERAREAEEAERLANCGHPLFSGCPTDDEIIYEESAETLCGGGRYDEAAAQGISCYPGHLP